MSNDLFLLMRFSVAVVETLADFKNIQKLVRSTGYVSHNFDSFGAETPESFIELGCERKPFNLVLIDVSTLNTSRQVYQKVRSLSSRPYVPIIVFVDPGWNEMNVDESITAIVPKSATRDDILEAMLKLKLARHPLAMIPEEQ